jgi:hypothetical protein
VLLLTRGEVDHEINDEIVYEERDGRKKTSGDLAIYRSIDSQNNYRSTVVTIVKKVSDQSYAFFYVCMVSVLPNICNSFGNRYYR